VDGDTLKGAFDRWHITSTDLHPASFPLLQTIATRTFCHGVAFHGFSKGPGDADLYIGGGASDDLKRAIRDALEDAHLPVDIRIATKDDNPKFQGASPENLINRLAAQGIHIEQSAEAREFRENIAKAIATVYRSPWKRLLCAWDEPRSLSKEPFPICDARFPAVARWLSRDLRKTHAWGMLAASGAPP
jgi:Poly-gamma-glutamate hydrolase